MSDVTCGMGFHIFHEPLAQTLKALKVSDMQIREVCCAQAPPLCRH